MCDCRVDCVPNPDWDCETLPSLAAIANRDKWEQKFCSLVDEIAEKTRSGDAKRVVVCIIGGRDVDEPKKMAKRIVCLICEKFGVGQTPSPVLCSEIDPPYRVMRRLFPDNERFDRAAGAVAKALANQGTTRDDVGIPVLISYIDPRRFSKEKGSIKKYLKYVDNVSEHLSREINNQKDGAGRLARDRNFLVVVICIEEATGLARLTDSSPNGNKFSRTRIRLRRLHNLAIKCCTNCNVMLMYPLGPIKPEHMDKWSAKERVSRCVNDEAKEKLRMSLHWPLIRMPRALRMRQFVNKAEKMQ